MTARAHALAITLVAGAVVAGCAGPRLSDKGPQRNEQSTPVQFGTLSLQRAFQVAQLKYGRGAPFELCLAELCPRITPKTLSRATALPLSGPISAIPLPPIESIKSEPILGVSTSQASVALAQVVAANVPELAARQVLVSFGTGSATLSASAMQALNAELPEALRASDIEIRGRTDALGRVADNDVLAKNRALAVREYLQQHKLADGAAIRVTFKGSCCYISANDTAAGRAANRRVEIEFKRPLQMAQGEIQ